MKTTVKKQWGKFWRLQLFRQPGQHWGWEQVPCKQSQRSDWAASPYPHGWFSGLRWSWLLGLRNIMCSVILCCWWVEFLNLQGWHLSVQRVQTDVEVLKGAGAVSDRGQRWSPASPMVPAPWPGAHRNTGVKGTPALLGIEKLKQQSTRAMGRSREPEWIQSWVMSQPHRVHWRGHSTTCLHPLLHSHCVLNSLSSS